MAINIGSVAVSVVPSAEGFNEKLRAQIGDLPNLELKLETAAAEAKIEEIRVALDSIRNQHVDVDVDDHGSAARTAFDIGAMGSAADVVPLKVAAIGAALLALIPIAAAASAAIAGIGLGIGAGVAGALVGKLALGGIPAALSASKSTGGGGGGGGGQSAASAALAAAQAADRQRQAEVALTVAQRQAIQAQRDLTQARVDAANALQDLSNNVIDNGLAQRQATFDLATAKSNLDAAKVNAASGNPFDVNAQQQAQLAFDQAKQNLAELQEKGQRLAVQKAAADKAGVDGSKQVVDAQNKVVDTQNALVEAQFQVSHSASAAAVSGAKAAGAMSAYEKAVAKLNPAQREFLGYLESVRGQFKQISNAASEGLLPGLQTAIGNLLPVLPAVATFIGDIARAFGDLAVNASKALTGPFWSQFFLFLDRIAAPTIGQFGSILGDLFTIAAASFQAFYPALKLTGDTLDGFLKHVANAIQGGALNGFVSYVKDNLPRVAAFFDSVGRAIGRIVTALAPLGGHLLDGLTAVLNGISKLPPGVLQGAAIGTGVAALGGKAAPIVAKAVPFAIANPELAVLGATAAAYAALYLKSKTFHDFVNDKLYPVLKRIALDAFDGLKAAIGYVNDAIQQNKPQLEELLHAFEDVASFIITKVLPVLGPILQGAFALIGWEIGVAITQLGWLVTAFNNLKQWAVDSYNGIVAAWGKVSGFFSGLWSAISADFKSAIDKIEGWAGDMVTFFTGLPGKIGAGVTGMWDGIKDAFKDVLNTIIGWWDDFISHLHLHPHTIVPGTPFSDPVKSPDVDLGAGLHIDQIRELGGPVWPGIPFIGNERGQEAFMPTVPGFITTASDTQRLVKAMSAMANGHGAAQKTINFGGVTLTDSLDVQTFTRQLDFYLANT